jgi:branched-chain amino acid transport system substrate-binding protein
MNACHRAASCVLIACALTSCAAPRPLRETSPVKIGMLADLSSTGAKDGNDALKGAELRVSETNAAGGVGGRQIELLVRDTKQSATEAVTAFTQLAQDERVCAVIGLGAPNPALSVSPVADMTRVPFVCLAVDDRVTNPDMKLDSPEREGRARQFAFLVQPSATQAAGTFARYAAEHFVAKRYATVYDASNPVSALQAHAFENAIKASGRVVAASVALPEGDLAAPVRALRDAGIEAAYVCASTDKDVAAAKAIHDDIPGAVLLGNQAWYVPQDGLDGGLAAVFGRAGNGAWFWRAVSPDDPGLTDIAASFKARFGEKPRPGVVPGWNAAGLVIAAVRKAGDSSPQKVRDALEQLTGHQALQGPIDMDRKTHRAVVLPVAVMRIVNDAYVTVEARFLYKPAKAP